MPKPKKSAVPAKSRKTPPPPSKFEHAKMWKALGKLQDGELLAVVHKKIRRAIANDEPMVEVPVYVLAALSVMWQDTQLQQARADSHSRVQSVKIKTEK